MQLVIAIPSREEQLAFNRKRWDAVLRDSFIASLPHRIETNCEGNLVMSPTPNFFHSERCQRINELLNAMLSDGKAYPEVPINTIDGIRATDVAWISDQRRMTALAGAIFEQAPEICVEVLSPGNTETEIRHKRKLYFDAGAVEVWECDTGWGMRFYGTSSSECPMAASEFCPRFPAKLVQ